MKPLFLNRYTCFTLVFYAVMISLSFYLEHVSPSGPCTPGLGMMLLITLPLLVFLLFAVFLTKSMLGHKKLIVSTALHGLVLVGYVILFMH